MPVVAFEDAKSRSFGVGSAEGTGTRIFHARASGESDIITAIVTAVAALAPYYWNNMVRLNIEPEHQGTDLYTATVRYATPSGGGDPNGGAGGGISSGNAC